MSPFEHFCLNHPKLRQVLRNPISMTIALSTLVLIWALSLGWVVMDLSATLHGS